MFYGIARGLNKNGVEAQFIIRNLQSRNRLGAEREAKRIAWRNGLKFLCIHLAANARKKQGEIKMNYSLPRERAKAHQSWFGR